MRALLVLPISTFAISGCETMRPPPFVLDGKKQTITAADLNWVIAETHRIAYPTRFYWPIYRVHVISATEVEVWYGRHDTPDRGMFIRFGRSTKRGEWTWTGIGGH